jgi:hypothetical protein
LRLSAIVARIIDVDLTARAFPLCLRSAPAVISLFSAVFRAASDNKSRISAAKSGLPLIFSCKEQQEQRARRVGI